ncbi:MAG: hypothetical protein P8186_18350 [Anaerolineae bacterium]
MEAGAEVVQDVMKMAPGLLVARLKDADGNFLGLRQSTEQEGGAPGACRARPD